METRKHVHEETFDADAETVFRLLHTPSAIRQWWGASHVIVDQKEGGVWVGLWGDEDTPEFITAGRMSAFEPPRRLKFSILSITRAKVRYLLRQISPANSP